MSVSSRENDSKWQLLKLPTWTSNVQKTTTWRWITKRRDLDLNPSWQRVFSKFSCFSYLIFTAPPIEYVNTMKIKVWQICRVFFKLLEQVSWIDHFKECPSFALINWIKFLSFHNWTANRRVLVRFLRCNLDHLKYRKWNLEEARLIKL